MAFCLFLLASPLGAHATDSNWDEVKKLYDSKNYSAALEKLRAAPSGDSSYFYNLGVLHFQLGQAGAAVAYLEKANSLERHNPSIQHNLALARAALSRVSGTEPQDHSSSWVESMADQISLAEVRGFLGLVAFILLLLWVRAYLKTRNMKRTFFRPGGYLGVFGLIIALSLYGLERLALAHPPAIAVVRQSVRSGPGDQYLELGQVDSGVKIRLLGTAAEVSGEVWQQVRFSEDSVGWVKASGLVVL